MCWSVVPVTVPSFAADMFSRSLACGVRVLVGSIACQPARVCRVPSIETPRATEQREKARPLAPRDPTGSMEESLRKLAAFVVGLVLLLVRDMMPSPLLFIALAMLAALVISTSQEAKEQFAPVYTCLLYTSPSPRDS